MSGRRALPPPPSPTSSSDADPFLAQTRDIPLTQRDRQEGYDIDLLRAQPRGVVPSTSAQSVRQHNRRDTGSQEGPFSLGRSKEREYGSSAALAGAAGASTGALATAGEYDGRHSLTAARGEKYSGDYKGTSRPPEVDLVDDEPPRKPWYLRPRALAVLVALIIAIALAVGLGVGLSRRGEDPELAAVGSPYGTVIPSSYGSIKTTKTLPTTSTSPPTTRASPSPTSTPTATPTVITAGDVLTFVSPARTANSLSTRVSNRPVPAESATTIGTTVFSALNDDDDRTTTLAPATTGERRRRRFFA